MGLLVYIVNHFIDFIMFRTGDLPKLKKISNIILILKFDHFLYKIFATKLRFKESNYAYSVVMFGMFQRNVKFETSNRNIRIFRCRNIPWSGFFIWIGIVDNYVFSFLIRKFCYKIDINIILLTKLNINVAILTVPK